MATTIMTIRRPNGDIERVEKPFPLTSAQRQQAIKLTKEAGRGDIIGFDVVAPKPVAWSHCCAYWTRDQGCPLHGDAE